MGAQLLESRGLPGLWHRGRLEKKLWGFLQVTERYLFFLQTAQKMSNVDMVYWSLSAKERKVSY